jgi:hypothetical protein
MNVGMTHIRHAALLATLVFAPAALNAQTLRVVKPLVSQSEDGPALERTASFQPGEVVYFSFQIENYKAGATGRVQLTGHIQAFDPKGTPIATPDEETIGTSLSEEDKQWKPKLRSQIQIPSIAPPGSYRIHFDVTDEQTHQSVSEYATFPVSGKSVDPSADLVIRDFGFYRARDEETALRTPAYRAGDILWVRFNMTGYKYGDQNAIDVSYDVAVTASNGRQLFSQEDAAVEKSQAFYPQPWIPAEFNLTLQSNMNPGVYTLLITAHDGIGKQTVPLKADFKVE